MHGCRPAIAPGARGARTAWRRARTRDRAPRNASSCPRLPAVRLARPPIPSPTSRPARPPRPESAAGNPRSSSGGPAVRHELGFYEQSRKVRAIAAAPGAQFALHRPGPAEKGLLIARQRPTGEPRQIPAVGPQPQPARASPLPRDRPDPGARAHPVPPARHQSQCKATAGRMPGSDGPVRRRFLPLQREPGVERQHLRGRPDQASGGDLRAIVQAAQDAGLAQVPRQQQAAGLEMGDATGVRIQSAASLTPAPA